MATANAEVGQGESNIEDTKSSAATEDNKSIFPILEGKSDLSHETGQASDPAAAATASTASIAAASSAISRTSPAAFPTALGSSVESNAGNNTNSGKRSPISTASGELVPCGSPDTLQATSNHDSTEAGEKTRPRNSPALHELMDSRAAATAAERTVAAAGGDQAAMQDSMLPDTLVMLSTTAAPTHLKNLAPPTNASATDASIANNATMEAVSTWDSTRATSPSESASLLLSSRKQPSSASIVQAVSDAPELLASANSLPLKPVLEGLPPLQADDGLLASTDAALGPSLGMVRARLVTKGDLAGERSPPGMC